MKAITGESDYDASALLEYFAPLKKFLDKHKKLTPIETDQTVPITVACIFGTILIVGVSYLLIKRLKEKKRRQN